MLCPAPNDCRRVKEYEDPMSHLAGAGLSTCQQQQMPVAVLMTGMAGRGTPDTPMRGTLGAMQMASATRLELGSLVIVGTVSGSDAEGESRKECC